MGKQGIGVTSGNGIAADVEEYSQGHLRPACKLAQHQAAMPVEDAEALDFAIEMVREQAFRPQSERYYTQAWLVALLNNNGYSIGKTAVSDHLSRKCHCDRI